MPKPAAASTPNHFELIAGHPALDLINTLDNRFDPARIKELIPVYEDLLRFAEQSEIITNRQSRKLKRHDASPAQRVSILRQTVELREQLATALYALLDRQPIPDPTLQQLEATFQRAASHRHLAQDEAQLAWTSKGISRDIASPLWLLAQSANDLITSSEIVQLRACASPICRWLFLDTSKNHSRRWCDMKICGNRQKARQFQIRQAAS